MIGTWLTGGSGVCGEVTLMVELQKSMEIFLKRMLKRKMHMENLDALIPREERIWTTFIHHDCVPQPLTCLMVGFLNQTTRWEDS